MNEANQDLGDRVKEALLRDTRSAGVDIQARAINGKVTLTGSVEVENSITVSTDGAIDDHEIQEDLSREGAFPGRTGRLP